MHFLVFVIIIAALFYYFGIVRKGRLPFWKKVQKYPEFFYTQFLKNESWIIDDGKVLINKDKYAGPFSIYVPSINEVIHVYGKRDKYINSQKLIEQQLSEHLKDQTRDT